MPRRIRPPRREINVRKDASNTVSVHLNKLHRNKVAMSVVLIRLLLSASLALHAGLANAQTGGIVKGTAMDAATTRPLPLANVVVKGTRYGAAADSSGYFEIKGIPPGVYVLEFRHVGFKTKFRVLNLAEGEEITMDINLDQEPISLPEVTVTDTADIDRLMHLSPGSLVVTRKMLLDTKETDLTHALKAVAPRYDLSITRQIGEIRRRPDRIPGRVSNVLILIDGHRIHPTGDDFYSDYNWLDNYISLDEVETIVIHRGDNAWMRAGRRGARLDFLIEVTRRRP